MIGGECVGVRRALSQCDNTCNAKIAVESEYISIM